MKHLYYVYNTALFFLGINKVFNPCKPSRMVFSMHCNRVFYKFSWLIPIQYELLLWFMIHFNYVCTYVHFSSCWSSYHPRKYQKSVKCYKASSYVHVFAVAILWYYTPIKTHGSESWGQGVSVCQLYSRLTTCEHFASNSVLKFLEAICKL